MDKIQQDLLQALKIELKHNHPKQRYIFPNLVMMMTDLRQVVEAFGQNLHIGVLDKSKDLVDTAPLIKEMFNLWIILFIVICFLFYGLFHFIGGVDWQEMY